MNKRQLITYLIKQEFSKEIVNAFEKIPREDFIPGYLKDEAYENMALPLGHSSTISQPYTIALMLQLLNPKKGEKILEIGSGSGYVLALINKITNSKVYGIERIKPLAETSKKTLQKNKQINIINSDGSKGLNIHTPYDKILVSASFKEIPLHLLKQLKPNGILVSPVKQSIFKITNTTPPKIEEHPGFVFVPVVEG